MKALENIELSSLTRRFITRAAALLRADENVHYICAGKIQARIIRSSTEPKSVPKGLPE